MNLKCTLETFYHSCSLAETQVPRVLAQLFKGKQTLRQGIYFGKGTQGIGAGECRERNRKLRQQFHSTFWAQSCWTLTGAMQNMPQKGHICHALSPPLGQVALWIHVFVCLGPQDQVSARSLPSCPGCSIREVPGQKVKKCPCSWSEWHLGEQRAIKGPKRGLVHIIMGL